MLRSFVLICEFVGGMTSVALTDAIQMTIMGCSFVVMFFSCVFYFGGFAGTVPYHCAPPSPTQIHRHTHAEGTIDVFIPPRSSVVQAPTTKQI